MGETKTENIFLFVPNVIGYARIVLAVIAFWYMRTCYVTATVCYFLSAFLDAFDGYAARYLNQGTRFGAMLDQLTDRMGTLGLLMTLCVLYPSYTFWFQLSAVIDVAGHWIHIWVSLLQGKSSHKFVDVAGNPVMHLYYTSRPVLFTFCACNEAFYFLIYLLYFTEGPLILGLSLFRLVLYICAPVSIIKSGITLLHMYLACLNFSLIDLTERKQLFAQSGTTQGSLESKKD